MLVETDSEACLREADSDAVIETDDEFKTYSDSLAETDALDSDTLVKAEAETLVDFEVNSDTEAD